jgi:hypothetical protein
VSRRVTSVWDIPCPTCGAIAMAPCTREPSWWERFTARLSGTLPMRVRTGCHVERAKVYGWQLVIDEARKGGE